MSTITLEHQIEFMRSMNDDHINLMSNTIIASLRRLRAIESQEPFGTVSYEVDSDNWPSDIQFTATHSSGADWENLTSGSQLYTLPVAPAIPDGMRLVPIEPTREMLDAVHSAAFETRSMPWKEAEIIRYKAMLAASEPQHD